MDSGPRKSAVDLGVMETAQASAELFQAIWEHGADAMVLSDANGAILAANPACCQLYGYAAAELAGQNLTVLFPGEAQDWIAEQTQALFARSEALPPFESTIRRDDGGERAVEARMDFISHNGQRTAMLVIIRDITERKQAQEAREEAEAAQRRLAFLAKASRILAESLDYEATLQNVARLAIPTLADWCIVHMVEGDRGLMGPIEADSPDIRTATGEARPDGGPPIRRVAMAYADSVKHHMVPELEYLQESDKPLRTGVTMAISTGLPEIHFYPADASSSSAEDTELSHLLHQVSATSHIIVPMLARGRALGAITLISCTPSRQYSSAELALAEELAHRAALAVDNARLYAQAREALRARDQFLSIASHELKTPLTSLTGYAELLQRRTAGSLKERDQHALRVIVEQANRLNKLISTMLDLSRIQTGQLTVDRIPVDLHMLTRRVVDAIQPVLKRHRIDIAVRPADASVVVLGDELRLEQVLQNLLQNAIKYSPAGGPIDVQITRRDNMACWAVSDHGIGIPQRALPNLFSRFYRANNAQVHQVSGLGVGLFVVKEIVNRHGGTVDVSSREGEGSTFTICLPLAPPNS